MEWQAIAVVLLAALLHASWNALVKVSDDRLVALGLANGIRFAMCLPAVFFLPLPHMASWPFLVLSALLHCGYYAFLVIAYRGGDLSQVYPLARGASPLLIVCGAFVFAGERLDGNALAGVALISAGIVSLAVMRQGSGPSEGQPVFYALLTAVFIAAYTLTDGMGVRRAGTVVGYVIWLSVLDGLPLLCLAALRRRGRFLEPARRGAWRAAIGALLQLLAYGLVLWVITFTPIAGVSALRETSVVFAALIGAWVLKEPLGRSRLVAALLVTTGIVVMKF